VLPDQRLGDQSFQKTDPLPLGGTHGPMELGSIS
jgi:hypothetical protein